MTGEHLTWTSSRRVSDLGLAGSALGVLAGIVQAGVGSRIPDWTGAKASPVALGLLTIVLSLLAAACAYVLRRTDPSATGRRLALVTGLLVPAALCFSTVGRLWYVPGALLLISAALALAAGSRRDASRTIRRAWSPILVSLLGGFEMLMGVSAAPVVAVVGVLGGLALSVAPWTIGRSRRVAVLLLVLGTLPFAFLAYWAIVPVLSALLVVVLAIPMLRAGRHAKEAVEVPNAPLARTGDVSRIA